MNIEETTACLTLGGSEEATTIASCNSFWQDGQNSLWGMVVTKDTDKQWLGPFFYLWFALSILLNVSGIASMVDGFVHRANFFRDFLDIYRHLIREPLSWTVHLVWSSWWPRIPPWVFDYLVICSGFFFRLNVLNIRHEGGSAVPQISHEMGNAFWAVCRLSWVQFCLCFEMLAPIIGPMRWNGSFTPPLCLAHSSCSRS